jgi:hypothetical protein
MTAIYATTGDRLSTKLNKQGEVEIFTIEGPRVITVELNNNFAEKYKAIQELWSGAIVRFENDRKKT